ncbi:RagB/SusD family nutrient uptake outer membrane protein [Pseudopedobacter beijingensis]|uniref:RagB/SusD family nutrient uptake outer membrane protein n=1 Tax=Pseudopedobacter beijingensis TaxID=1207056 RepID=A0ABW4IEM5_9SPHI
MKNYINIIALLVIIGVTSSCKNVIEENPKGFIPASEFFKNEAQCIAALNGCYTPLNSIYKEDLMFATEAVTDLAFLKVTNNVDTRLDISPSQPGMGAGIWTQSYKGIMYSNAAIEGIQNATIEESRKPALIAEAVTLRALYYYILTSTFGDVPFYLENISDIPTMERVNSLGRMSAVASRDSLVKNLLEHVSAMPHVRPSEISGNRVSAPLAYILIGKLAMWNKDWETALTALKKIKTIYGNLTAATYPLTDTYFRNKNTRESIFEVQYTWSATGLRKTTNVACSFTPPRTANTSLYNGINIPELGDKATIYTSVTPSEYFMELYRQNTLDPRRNIILGYSYNGTPFPRPQANNGLGKAWMGPKFWCPGMDNISDGNNQKVFRYADAILMMAECSNELDEYPDALKYLNEVRTRAQNSTLSSFPGKTLFRKEIKEERARELMGEYGRKWDLVRWGTFYDDVKATIALEYPDIMKNIRPYHEYYPIPDNEVVKSNGKLDNNAYTGF